MKLTNVKIAREKLSHYLLTWREEDDKSGYLALAGFSQESSDSLMEELVRLTHEGEALLSRTNEYGDLLALDGELTGPNGHRIGVRTIWIRRRVDEETHFVTLVPLEIET